ncbi:hypothetical protein CROQUDRAFT_651992 [Cronartium quercuum f. sp. fusiforme G11]|uniref:Uncharacterized protein n=1 Tax=Cronartium quercuum f. sp. fusiforme G11 TaxID=708437 RepID=A0A9P6TG93_9BASI|nr:hypothetical protein CROQUDRAFT_651992 [Cronartium quercuum f. sp. fusiforme G11]
MKPSPSLAYLRPPKPKPNRSPFTRPTTYTPPHLLSAHHQISKQTDFNHLVHHALPAAAKGTSSRPAAGIRKDFYFVHFSDRIKFWNLTAGDRVIVADCTREYRGKIGTVYWVDRTSNRLALLEPEFWTEKSEKAHPDLPEYTRNVPVEFEYSTVRLMAPGSDELYYENLREVQHEAVTKQGRKKEIHWTRIGTPHSIRHSGPLRNVEEIIPWPVEPRWMLGIQDADKRIEGRDRHQSLMEAEWAKELRRRDGEWVDKRVIEVSHVRSRENRKDLFASPIDSWTSTFDPEQYEDYHLWLSSSPVLRERFPDYFISATHNLVTVPELEVPDWELTAGRHTRRYKTMVWEQELARKVGRQIDAELNWMVEKAEAVGMVLDREQTRRELELTSSMRPSVIERQKTRPSVAEVKRARTRIQQLRARFSKVEAKATLDLLPALESFNSNRMRERLTGPTGAVLGPVLDHLDQTTTTATL